MKSLKIFKASAGSGKTHTLTREYLCLALKSPRAFERIQAVTFTNKATEEMKERILRELYRITRASAERFATDTPMGYEIAQALDVPPTELQRRASKTLQHILQDYSGFRISTIDSFFQEILRSFTRELGLQGNFRLELEHKRAFDAAVQGVIADQEQGSAEAQDWLYELTLERIDDGDSYDVTRLLGKLSGELSKDRVAMMILNKRLPTHEQLKQLKSLCHDEYQECISWLKEIANKILDEYYSVGLTVQDMSNGKSGGLSVFFKIQDKDSFRLLLKDAKVDKYKPKRLVSACEELSSLFTKANKHLTDRLSSTKIHSLMTKYCQEVDKLFELINSVSATLSNIGSYGMIRDIANKLQEQQRAEGSLLLTDAPSLIHGILSDEGGSSFIFEKIGTRIDHHMIDEFQDTSTMQYLDFKPLLEESMAQGFGSLVVGDIKQSIYRWRGSDSSLLDEQIGQDFEGMHEVVTLEANYRSAPQIIAFNNALYPQIAQGLSQGIRDLIHGRSEHEAYKQQDVQDLPELFMRYYADVEQIVPEVHAHRQGTVCIHRVAWDEFKVNEYPNVEHIYLEGDDDNDLTCLEYQLPRLIVDVQRRGYKPSDIAILVRTQSQARWVAELMEEATKRLPQADQEGISFGFISQEALSVGRSVAVRLLVSMLRYITQPSSELARLQIQELARQLMGHEAGHDEVDDEALRELLQLGRRSLYETLDAIVERFSSYIPQGEYPYVIKLLEMVLSYQQDRSVDIADFLKMWDEKGEDQKLLIAADEHKMHLMTIHKAKGLDYPVVLLPFVAKMSDKPNSRDILWCQNPWAEACGVDYVPISSSSKLLNSCFAGNYLIDEVKNLLDDLNVLYVATTRASQEMHIWLSKDPKESKDALPALSSVVEEAVRAMDESLYIDTDTQPMQGLPQSKQRPSQVAEMISIDALQSYPFDKRIAVLAKGLEHFTDPTPRSMGSLMHRILDDVVTLNDLPSALDRAEQAGELAHDQRQVLEEYIHMATSREPMSTWFDGSGQVLRERPIIGGAIDTYRRPDRVILYPDGSATVVDYKFGSVEYRYYLKQVEEYMALLSSMGYAPVRGYLWYVLQGEVKTI